MQLMSKRNLLLSLIIDAVIVMNFIFLALSVNTYAKTVLNPSTFTYEVIDPLTYLGIVIVFSYPVISRIYAFNNVRWKLIE